ncbi:hypothetical protein V2J09_011320 [Rumex salicifolius]
MELPITDITTYGCPSFSFMPTTCSKKFLIHRNETRKKWSSRFVILAKKLTQAASMGLQTEPKKDLSRILWTEAAVQNIEKKAKSKKYINLWPKAVLEALNEAIKNYRWESALQIFGLLRKQHWYEPRYQTYTKLLVMLGKCRKSDEAGKLFEILLSDGLKPTIDVCTALVNAYGLSNHFDLAFLTLEDMKSIYDCKPDVHTYSALINCCLKNQRVDLVDRILTEMSYLRIQCSEVTYNTIIDGYGKATMFELMEKSLSEMINSGTCLPDIFTLNSVVWAYGNDGHIEKMEKWYEEFQLMGIRPDVRTFNILIRSYGKAGMYEKVSSVLSFMEKRLYSPTVVTFNIVIDIFGRVGQINMMDELFLKMKHQGTKPNTITYCSLVNAYSKAGKLHRVESIVRQVENSDVVLDTPFFNCVISAYGRVGDIDKMNKLFLSMKEYNCKPDSITFATMIQAYKAKGMDEAVLDVEMLEMKNRSGTTKLIGK